MELEPRTLKPHIQSQVGLVVEGSSRSCSESKMQKKSNFSKTDKKGLRRMWVHMSENVFYLKEEDQKSEQWLLRFYKEKVAYVPTSESKKGRYCKFHRKKID